MSSIDVVIPVHTGKRPLARAVASCFDGNDPSRIRVTVVCHNVGQSPIENLLGGTLHADRIRYLELNDGINSPSGPKNLGLAAAEADYVTVLDSDDYFEPGALDSWKRHLDHSGSGLLVAPLRSGSGKRIRTPRVRPGKSTCLDPVKDRLAYATAPRGLWKTSLLRAHGWHYKDGLRTGEDLETGLKMWFSGEKIDHPARGCYVLADDAGDRVTSAVLPLGEEFRAILDLDPSWLESLSPKARRSIAVKLARVNLLAGMFRRGSAALWNEGDLQAIKRFMALLGNLSASYDRPLARADSKFLSVLRAPGLTEATVQRALRAYEQAGRWDRVLASSILGNLDAESNFRHFIRLRLYDLFRAP